MGPTIYASFEDKQTAQTAIGALIHSGVPADGITLACKNNTKQTLASDLNPAQDDYPRGTGESTTEFSSAPPDAQRDYNSGIEADDYNTNYKGDVGRDIGRDFSEDERRIREHGSETDRGPTTNEDYAQRGVTDSETRGSQPPNANEDDQEFGAMAGTFPDLRAQGPGNSMGDPSMGSMGTRFAGIAATANAASNPGGMTDFLWSTLPVDFAKQYQQAYDGGKAVLIIRSESPDTATKAESVLREHGATQIERQGYLA